MSRTCPNCATVNKMGTIECPKCGNSLLPIIDREVSSLSDLRVFSIILLLFGILNTAVYVLNVVDTGSYLSGGFLSMLGLNGTNLNSSNLTTLFLLVEVGFVVTLFLEILSYVYLRAGFSKLAENDYNYETPKTGVTLLIAGGILVMVGLSVILALLGPLILAAQTGNVTSNLGLIALLGASGIIAIIGGLIFLVGYILGVLLGFRRTAGKFEEPLFDIGWILLLISIFFSPLSLVSAVLFLMATSTTRQRLYEVKSANGTIL